MCVFYEHVVLCVLSLREQSPWASVGPFFRRGHGSPRPALTLALKVLAAQDLTWALEMDGLKVEFSGFVSKYLWVVYL